MFDTTGFLSDSIGNNIQTGIGDTDLMPILWINTLNVWKIQKKKKKKVVYFRS